jgi:hypothetical protein
MLPVMPPLPTKILYLGEANVNTDTRDLLTWDYSDKCLRVNNAKSTDGAFRAFSVADLLGPKAFIRLSEWKDLRHGDARAEHPANYPKYAAISHVWEESDDTIRIANEKERPLWIKIEDKPIGKQRFKKISWYGLVEAANAANTLGCEYLWLDFLCLDQLSPRGDDDHDKAMQINNMANIYMHAKAVICMLGGVSAVQAADKETAWMDRAWTLQEALINHNSTWAYLRLPPLQDVFSFWGHDIRPVQNEPAKYLLKLHRLLDLDDVKNLLPKSFNVVCLDGKKNTKRGRIAAKNAMLSYFRGQTRELRLAGVWRAMLLRTSTKPVDIVYSVMGLFKVKLNPYSEDYDLQYLFNDLARKAAAVGSDDSGSGEGDAVGSDKGHAHKVNGMYGMEWLCIGGVLGSVGRLQRDDSSFLIPKVPDYARAHGAPWYFVGEKGKLSGDLVDDSRLAISRYHITFITDSQPHIICAVMLKVRNIKPVPSAKGATVKEALISLGAVKGLYCRYHGKIDGGDIKAVVVGTVGSWDNFRSPIVGQQYVMFMKWMKDGWKLVGDGTVPVKEVWLKGIDRQHFTIGTGSQRVHPTWPCDVKPTLLSKKLPRSYGVVPLDNYGTNDQGWDVSWFGYKVSNAPQNLCKRV